MISSTSKHVARKNPARGMQAYEVIHSFGRKDACDSEPVSSNLAHRVKVE